MIPTFRFLNINRTVIEQLMYTFGKDSEFIFNFRKKQFASIQGNTYVKMAPA
jgi:hypothetical protein